MSLTYLDSSAVVKRYVTETGSTWVIRLCEREPIVVSLVTMVEIASALARRTHEGVITVQQRDTLFRLFLRDTRSFVVVDCDQSIAQQAAALLLTAPAPLRLRSLDALHVASARWTFARARRRGVATGSFVTADRALIKAAEWAGLDTINPEDWV
ncbi:MAG: type II toxin-antitoxin system VapC family toxin [Chloroflexota bacterium]|nr:type II toxin-antitoxin system VapC family toxin [Dehalococcoidales bacterium]